MYPTPFLAGQASGISRKLQQYLSENPGATATNLIAPPPSRFAATLAGDRLSIDMTQERLNRVS
jgi:hypothetical protein